MMKDACPLFISWNEQTTVYCGVFISDTKILGSEHLVSYLTDSANDYLVVWRALYILLSHGLHSRAPFCHALTKWVVYSCASGEVTTPAIGVQHLPIRLLVRMTYSWITLFCQTRITENPTKRKTGAQQKCTSLAGIDRCCRWKIFLTERWLWCEDMVDHLIHGIGEWNRYE